MTQRYYLAPYVEVDLVGGAWALSPGSKRNASQVILYGGWDDVNRFETIIPVGPNGKGKVFCLTHVDASDAIHTLIQADAGILEIPFGPAALDMTFGSLSATNQTRLTTAMENRGLDSSWIIPATTLRQIEGDGAEGRRPAHGAADKFQTDPHWQELVLFYEYFHGDSGAGLGASHQTGWTALVAKFFNR